MHELKNDMRHDLCLEEIMIYRKILKEVRLSIYTYL